MLFLEEKGRHVESAVLQGRFGWRGFCGLSGKMSFANALIYFACITLNAKPIQTSKPSSDDDSSLDSEDDCLSGSRNVNHPRQQSF